MWGESVQYSGLRKGIGGNMCVAQRNMKDGEVKSISMVFSVKECCALRGLLSHVNGLPGIVTAAETYEDIRQALIGLGFTYNRFVENTVNTTHSSATVLNLDATAYSQMFSENGNPVAPHQPEEDLPIQEAPHVFEHCQIGGLQEVNLVDNWYDDVLNQEFGGR